MKRSKFLQNLLWVSGGLLTGCRKPISDLVKQRIGKVHGLVTSGGTGIAGIVVSDGYSVVQTNANGSYEITLTPQSEHIFISTPAGYAFPQQSFLVRQYQEVQESVRELNFELQKLSVNDKKHQFLIWADPQVKNAQDLSKLMAESVPDVKQYINSQPSGTLIHGITLGDIVWDEHSLFTHYNQAVLQTGVPFFQVLGNHDMDYNKGEDDRSDDTFKRNYGPSYYSFNRGQVHYVVLDDVLYLGSDRNYKGSVTRNQLEWLKKDLAFVPKDRLIVLCLHIPMHNAVDNRQALYDMLRDYKVHIMSGHTHYNRNVISGNVYEHVHGTVCGAWWTGPVCEDGTPSGYGIYEVDGTDLKWQYKSTGKPLEYQISTQVYTNDKGQKEVQANVWNWDPQWMVAWWANDIYQGTLNNISNFDPQTLALYLGDQLPQGRGFVEPRKTDHLFQVVVPPFSSSIRFIATDPFGRTYQAIAQV